MAVDVSKHLDRAKRCLEKNRVEEAIEAYQTVLNEAPNHQEATQALGDLYARLEKPDRAAFYYGLLFDLLVEGRDETKALAIYNRFLRPSSAQHPPERIARYAFLLQKQKRGAKKTPSSALSASRSSILKIFRGSCAWRKARRASARMPSPCARFCARGSWPRPPAPKRMP
jgi:tetratricopeptide (TPR) repeat protein